MISLSLYMLLLFAGIISAWAVGGDRDAHNCVKSAGYVYCEHLQQCIRPWETECEPPAEDNNLAEATAAVIKQEGDFEGGDYQDKFQDIKSNELLQKEEEIYE